MTARKAAAVSDCSIRKMLLPFLFILQVLSAIYVGIG